MGLNESEAALRSELSDLSKAKDMLELDKSYLSRELSSMAMKYENESRLVDAQKAQTSTAEMKVLYTYTWIIYAIYAFFFFYLPFSVLMSL